MAKTTVISLAVSAVVCAVLLSGCIKDTNSIHGYVMLDGKTVSGASIKAVSDNGTIHFEATTDAIGAFVLHLPKGIKFNVTATSQGLQHMIWPVSIGDDYYEYNITLTDTPKSYIRGTGYSVGGYVGYDNSRPLTGFTFDVRNLKTNATFTTKIQKDWSYSVEAEPGITYRIERQFPAVHFWYRNGPDVWPMDVVVGPNETALVDYIVVLP